MGIVSIKVDVQDEKANAKLTATKPNVSDLSVALAQLELMKINLMGKIAKQTQFKAQ